MAPMAVPPVMSQVVPYETWQGIEKLARLMLEALGRSSDPIRVDKQFCEKILDDPKQFSRELRAEVSKTDPVWLAKFFGVLVSKGAVDRRQVNGSAYFRMKNRYFTLLLIDDMKAGNNRFQELLTEANVGFVRGPAPSVPPADRTYVEPPPPPPRPNTGEFTNKPLVGSNPIYQEMLGAQEAEMETNEAPEQEPEEPEHEEASPPAMAPAPHRPKRIDAGAVYDLLETVNTRLEASVGLQQQLAETLIFVKDEVVFIRDKQIALSKKLKALEDQGPVQTSDVPSPKPEEMRDGFLALADGVADVGLSVNSLREEVRTVVKGIGQGEDAGKAAILADAIGRLTDQVRLLRDLVAEAVEDTDG